MRKRLSRYVPMGLVGLTALYGLWKLLELKGDAAAGGFALWALGAFIGWTAFHSPAREHWSDAFSPWIFAVAGILVLLLPGTVALLFGICLLVSAVSCFVAGTLQTLRLIPAFLLFLVLLPQQEILYFHLGMPMSEITSTLTVGCLKLFGVEVSNVGAEIQMGAEKIAVTTKCSGIEQLQALACIGWVFVRQYQRNPWIRFIHVLTLLPVLLITNTLRLIATLVLYLFIGDRAFADDFHTAFGLVMVLVSALMLWGVGALLTLGMGGHSHDSPKRA